jgi:hypothetical protein
LVASPNRLVWPALIVVSVFGFGGGTLRSNASYEASSHKFFPPIDDKTILTAICLIRLFFERRKPRIGLVVE